MEEGWNDTSQGKIEIFWQKLFQCHYAQHGYQM